MYTGSVFCKGINRMQQKGRIYGTTTKRRNRPVLYWLGPDCHYMFSGDFILVIPRPFFQTAAPLHGTVHPWDLLPWLRRDQSRGSPFSWRFPRLTCLPSPGSLHRRNWRLVPFQPDGCAYFQTPFRYWHALQRRLCLGSPLDCYCELYLEKLAADCLEG